MVPGILGKKLGMTQIFDGEGKKTPITLLEVGPCTVQAVRTEAKDGYCAVQLGYDDTKEKRVKKPQRAYLKAKSLPAKKMVREIRCTEDPGVEIGSEITNSMIQVGDYLDITGVSKGKGFQGGVKRHGWAGGNASHGGKSTLRAPGSIGQSSYPSRVFKGMGMPGHMGNQKVTTQNIEVIDVDLENHTVAVKGSVPGSKGTYLMIRYALKKPLAERVAIEEPEVEKDLAPEEAAERKEEAVAPVEAIEKVEEVDVSAEEKDK